jgi:3-oxoacyl-[acyl-carrier protein] reductase
MSNIIITGSNRGIGNCISKEWAKRNNDNCYYGFTRWNDLDVTDINSIKHFFKILKNTIDYQKPIALINNAAIVESGTILELSNESWQNQFNVNVNGVFNCCKEYIKFCIENNIKGKIINIASTAGLGGRPGRAAYAATKAAIINFSFSLAEELKLYGIKVYIICPGAVDTDMRHYLVPDDNFENMMKPEEVGTFVCDLIEDGKYLDNQILEVKK